MKQQLVRVAVAVFVLAAIGWFYCSLDILRGKLEDEWKAISKIGLQEHASDRNVTGGREGDAEICGSKCLEMASETQVGDAMESAVVELEEGNGEDEDNDEEEGPKNSTSKPKKVWNPPVDPSDKMIVAGKLDREYTNWIDLDLPDWNSTLYTVDRVDAENPVIANKGREAMAYLTYIIENYHHLPSIIAFIHAHRDGWHITDNPRHSNVISLKTLNTTFVAEQGYVNLNCKLSPGCPANVKPFGSFTILDEARWQQYIAPAWDFMLGINRTSMPDTIATPCCAQFAVSRPQVLKRPLAQYERIREWLLHTELGDYSSGRILEYSWHVIFGKDAIHCPDEMECLCKVFGQCEAVDGIDPRIWPRHTGEEEAYR